MILDTPEQIAAFRLKVIESGLRLESLGMRHSTNSVTKAAKQILKAANIKPARIKKDLYAQFVAYRKTQTQPTLAPLN